MLNTYDADLTLALLRQRSAELRAEADRQRLAQALRRHGASRAPWWRRTHRGTRIATGDLG
jgi:hypothetical protein